MSYVSREMMLHMAVCKWMEILIGWVTWKGKVIDKRLEACKEKENLYFNVFETTLPQVLRTERVTIKAWIKEMGNVAQGTKAGRHREELGGDNTPLVSGTLLLRLLQQQEVLGQGTDWDCGVESQQQRQKGRTTRADRWPSGPDGQITAEESYINSRDGLSWSPWDTWNFSSFPCLDNAHTGWSDDRLTDLRLHLGCALCLASS